MKTTYKILSLALASAAFTACADLDTEYLGGMVTPEQKGDVLEQNPDMALASVTGIASDFFKIFSIGSSHLDFAYSAVMIGLDSQGMDYTSKNSGYNWFSAYNGYTYCQPSGWVAAQMWFYNYGQIGICNNVAASIPDDTEVPDLMFYLAQAKAFRAFDYWTLAQVYQFNYAYQDCATRPCVPVITDKNMDEVAANGAPRNTVTEVYDQILADLDDAIRLLSTTTTTAESVMSVKPKRFVTLATAYGLRARVYLSMHKYAEAAADAQAAISNFAGRPYSRDEVSVPTFTSINDASWMWGIAIFETLEGIEGGSIVNFPAMTCTFSHGYCDQGGAWRWISKKLFNSIPASDVRKGWWLDENYESPNLDANQAAYLQQFILSTPSYGVDQTVNLMPYTNVKFAPYKNVLQTALNASDVPLMRVEEMYLTLAEATGMSQSVEAGKTILENFVKTYRDGSYKCSASSQADFQDECWRQRRIELWGEGLSYFDIMRLHKGIDRRGCAFPQSWVYNFPYGSDCMLFCIPTDEIAANNAISESDNNPASPQPTPVEDVE